MTDRPMYTLIAKRKGGVGASTTAVALAVGLLEDPHARVVLVDADATTQSVRQWWSRCWSDDDLDLPEDRLTVVGWDPSCGVVLTETCVRAARAASATHVIIDMGADKTILEQAAARADMLICPMSPMDLDAEALLDVAAAFAPQGVPTVAILTRVNSEGRGAAARWRRICDMQGVPILLEVKRHARYERLISGGAVVTEGEVTFAARYPADIGVYASLARQVRALTSGGAVMLSGDDTPRVAYSLADGYLIGDGDRWRVAGPDDPKTTVAGAAVPISATVTADS